MCVCVCVCVMSLKKYDWQNPNMSHTAIMLKGHTDPTFLHMCATIQPTAISTSHGIAMYLPATNMPLKWHMYAVYVN